MRTLTVGDGGLLIAKLKAPQFDSLNGRFKQNWGIRIINRVDTT
jgi:hypothetical protein